MANDRDLNRIVGDAEIQSGEHHEQHATLRDATIPKKKSPTSKTLVKEGLKSNLSAVEATMQLKVLCRKFAALTEKVKEETRIRVEAEKEVRRLKLIIEGNDVPVIASARAETQALVKELREEQERLKQELNTERDKNDKLVRKALELEREKKELIAAKNAMHQNNSYGSSNELSNHRTPTTWEREQTQRVHNTFRETIDELQEELGRKEEELASFREQRNYERSQLKALERQLQERDQEDAHKQNVLRELEMQLDEQREQFLSLEREMDRSNERSHDESTVRTTLELQIETLNQVNDALEQRARTLVKRLELSSAVANERDELRAQLRDTEIDKETLVRTIKDIKDQNFIKETQWKCQIEQLRTEKTHLSSHITELQSDITSLRAQNALFSEWMLVRNENQTMATTQQVRAHGTSQQYQGESLDDPPPPPPIDGYQQLRQSQHLSAAQVRPLVSTGVDKSHLYVHTSPRHPLSPSKTRSMTTASPIKQSCRPASPLTAIYSTKSPHRYKKVVITPNKRAANLNTRTRLSDTESTRLTTNTTLTDHERLRALMNRNRELQQRLQQETIATRNLEEEITHMTSNGRSI